MMAGKDQSKGILGGLLRRLERVAGKDKPDSPRGMPTADRAITERPGSEPQRGHYPPAGIATTTFRRTVFDSAAHPLMDGRPPEWASGWGEDRFGVWVEFALGDVSQRMRWIPPGQFWMGSPEGEAGRYEYEAPRHLVTISSGFWMMDTTVRQCLWQTVMSDNPSRFKSPDRPVENVDWEMVQQFLQRLNSQADGLDLSLPSEAQWEYACRAKSGTATYAGDLEILGECNAPVLDAIAWYGGNSGIAFDLKDGWDSSNWMEKQYPDSPSGTHPVGRKRENAFGLYDMLGNVWEWCADHWHGNYNGASADGSAWMEDAATANRVMRGGSWYNQAKDVRAACRGIIRPEFRGDGVAFRCVQVPRQERSGGTTISPWLDPVDGLSQVE